MPYKLHRYMRSEILGVGKERGMKVYLAVHIPDYGDPSPEHLMSEGSKVMTKYTLPIANAGLNNADVNSPGILVQLVTFSIARYCAIAPSCTETFYKTALAEQIQGEPARTNEEKRQMLELLKRFEEEAAEDGDQEEGTDDITSRLQGIDLGIMNHPSSAYLQAHPQTDTTDHDTLWGLLTEDERRKFLQLIANPTSGDSKKILDTEGLTEKPWWDSAVSEGKAPAIRPLPQNMLGSKQFNPMLLFNVFHLSLSYAYTVRTFGVSTLHPVGHQSPSSREEAEAFTNILFPLSPFLVDRKSTVPPPPAFVRLLLADSKTLFQAKPVVDTTENTQNSAHDSCMRFLSDILSLVASSKKHTHINLKLTFYLALIARLPTQASKDLVNAIRMWEAKTQVDEEVIEPPARRKTIVEELL
ncbi:hypothetical protein FRC06_005837 [Ceratobasidium sp. 370]|nr:hypothetical protein FRC06_005837 [Ceratobasidium sp. 370]